MAWGVFLEERPWEGRDRLHIMRDGVGGQRHIVGPFTTTAMPTGLITPEGLVAMDSSKDDIRAFLQTMMDCAYEAGIRPSRAQDERHIKAHLEDMRRIAFHGVGLGKGEG